MPNIKIYFLNIPYKTLIFLNQIETYYKYFQPSFS